MEVDELQAVIAEQRQELVVSQTLDFNTDYAFQLQMQEAMSASEASETTLALALPR